MHFDCAVNQGVSRATRFLQQAVGTEVDGEVGPLTRAAAASMPVANALESYAHARRRHYKSLHHFWRFGRGWLRRVTRTLERAKKWLMRCASRHLKSQRRRPDPHQRQRPRLLTVRVQHQSKHLIRLIAILNP